jgi:hypothetical protein
LVVAESHIHDPVLAVLDHPMGHVPARCSSIIARSGVTS